MEAALDSYLVLFELTGLQYFSLKRLTCDNFKDPPSIFRTIYMFVLIGVVSFLMYIYIFVDKASVSGVMTSNILMRAIINSLSIGLILVVSVSLVQSYLSTRATKKIFYNINQMAEICLDEFGVKVNYKRIKASIWKRGATMITFFVITHGGVTLFLYNDSPEEAFRMLIGSIPILLLFMIIYKFVFYVDMVNNQLEFVETLLDKTFQPEAVKVVGEMCFKNTFDDPLKKLRAIRNVYNIIFESGALVNRSNGLTILILLLDLVISITASGYEIFVIAVGSIPIQRIPGS